MSILFGDRSVIGVMSIPVVISDAQKIGFPILYANAAFEALTGYSLDEIHGRSCKFLQIPGENLEENIKIRNCLSNLAPVRSVLTNYHKNGSRFINEVSINPIAGPDGVVTHFVGTQSVVANVAAETERQQLKIQFDLLTPREKEVFTALSNGDNNKGIAINLGISYRTVEKHRANLKEKMGIGSIAQLVRQRLLLDLSGIQ